MTPRHSRWHALRVEQSFSPKARLELDPVGLYYASVTSRTYPATYSVCAHLSEPVAPLVLQEAVNDLMRRLPFLNARLRRDFFWYYHEILAEPPVIVPAEKGHTFSAYYEGGTGHVLRVLYGERHFAVEALHSICDGRGLMKAMSALLERYFQILGITKESAGSIDWSAAARSEEAEDAYARYADAGTTDSSTRTTDSSTKETSSSPERPVYRFDGSPLAPARFVTRTFDLASVRSAAKAHDATISEYVLAHIFRAIAEDRALRGHREPITALVPIDCRAFFPSETYLNFVADEIMAMPETNDLPEMVQGVRQRFRRIDADLVRSDINAYQRMRTAAPFLPRVVKTLISKRQERSGNSALTTTFSNLGLVRLPKEVEERVEKFEAILGPALGMRYEFGSVGFGNALTLTMTVSTEDRGLSERIAEGLEGSGQER